MRVLTLFVICHLAVTCNGQASFGIIDGHTAVEKGVLTLGTELEGVDDTELVSSENKGDKDYSDDVLVIPNEFPDTLTRICYPRTPLMRDRFCIGNVDAFALACAGGRPPLQLAPFCQGFDDICDRFDFPEDEWCEKDFSVYRRHCAFSGRTPCEDCSTRFEDCSCEPYVCLWRQKGLDSARWCQKYELFCNAESRRKSAEKLVSVLESSIRLHTHCYTLWNVARTICNPFRNKYDFKRCQKFLIDCELLGDFQEEDQEEAFLVEAEKEVNKEKGKINGTDPSSTSTVPKKTVTEEEDTKMSLPSSTTDHTTVQMKQTTSSTTSPKTDSSARPKNPFSHLRLASQR
ncbi:hypothetical protein PRIPAC_94537 [Pristionchus pacificus]|nr:hypothetical protein PRIPAC_94537 [Pristionchus pacificus]